MHARSAVVVALVVAASLVGCSSGTDPDPSSTAAPSADAPSTLDELEDALVDEGVVDGALLDLPEPLPGDPESLYLGLQWEDLPTTAAQLATLADVQRRIDDVLDDRPAVTRLVLSGGLAEGGFASVDVAIDPGREALGELLAIASTTACSEVTGLLRDEVLADGGSVETLLMQLDCAVEGADAVDLASRYDAVTAIAPVAPIVASVRWVVTLEGSPGIHPRLQLEAPPVEGRQQLFVDLMTTALDAGAEGLAIEDYGDRVDVAGFLPSDAEPVCQTLYDRMVAANVERRTVSFDALDAPEGETVDVCFLQP